MTWSPTEFHATENTQLECPISCATVSPDTTSNSVTTPESLAAARSLPPGENRTHLTGLTSPISIVRSARNRKAVWITVQRVMNLVREVVEDVHAAVLVSRGNQVPVRRLSECQASHRGGRMVPTTSAHKAKLPLVVY